MTVATHIHTSDRDADKALPRPAVVTGGAGPIGRAIAERLAASGRPVAVIDIDEDGAGTTVERIVSSGGSGVAVVADIRDPRECEESFTVIAERFGEIEVLVNNAGALSLGDVLSISGQEWSKVLEVNLLAPLYLSRELASRLVAQGLSGVIVNIGSVAGVRAMMNRAHYCASKGGVQGLTRALADELSGRGIRVNCINPKAIVSGMSGNWRSAADGRPLPESRGWLEDDAQRVVVMQSLPVGRHGYPDDIASTVEFLVSPSASSITGVCIDVDGGYLAGDTFTV